MSGAQGSGPPSVKDRAQYAVRAFLSPQHALVAADAFERHMRNVTATGALIGATDLDARHLAWCDALDLMGAIRDIVEDEP